MNVIECPGPPLPLWRTFADVLLALMAENESPSDMMTIGRTKFSCRCRFDISKTSGVVSGASAALWAAFIACGCAVVAADGRCFSIVVTKYVPGKSEAPFKLIGHVVPPVVLGGYRRV